MIKRTLSAAIISAIIASCGSTGPKYTATSVKELPKEWTLVLEVSEKPSVYYPCDGSVRKMIIKEGASGYIMEEHGQFDTTYYQVETLQKSGEGHYLLSTQLKGFEKTPVNFTIQYADTSQSIASWKWKYPDSAEELEFQFIQKDQIEQAEVIREPCD